MPETAVHRNWWWVVPLALGAAIRLSVLRNLSQDPALQAFQLLDADLYASMADRIVAGDWLLGHEPYSVGPLYAYLLAASRAFFGHSNLALFLLQSLVGLGSVALVTRAARRLSSTAGACAAGSAFALYGPTVMLEGKLLGETFAVFLTLASIDLLVRARRARLLLLSGACLGAACLLRPDLLLVAPLVAGWVALSGARLVRLCSRQVANAPGASAREWGSRLVLLARISVHRVRRRAVRVAAIWLLGVALVVSLATIRNFATVGEVVLISAQGGITFYQGNNPRAEGTFSVPLGFAGDKAGQEITAKRLAEQAVGRDLSYSEVSEYWFGRGIDYWFQDPADTALLLLRKAGYWLSSAELSADHSLAAQRCLQPTLKFAFVPFGLFLVSTAFSLKRTLMRHARVVVPHLAFALGGCLVGLLFYVSTRYRLCAAAHLAVFVGPAFDAVFLRRSAAHWSRLTATLASVALLLTTLLPGNDAPARQAASELRNWAFLHYQDGNPHKSLPLLVAARNARSDNWEIRYTLGHVLALLGDYEAATSELEAALRIRPQSAETRKYLDEYRRMSLSGSKRVKQEPTCQL